MDFRDNQLLHPDPGNYTMCLGQPGSPFGGDPALTGVVAHRGMEPALTMHLMHGGVRIDILTVVLIK